MTALMFGIQKSKWDTITNVFAAMPSIEKVILYGSRAKGNFKNGSDIDLAIFGNNFDLQQLRNLMNNLDELLLPYTFDITIYNDITNVDLKLHIDSVGKIIYQKNSTNI